MLEADGHEAANRSCQCLTHSRELSPAWKSGLRVHEWVFQSELHRNGGGWVTDCWSSIEFWQVATCTGPARSLEDVLPWTWTPELISHRFSQFYGCLDRFHFFWKSTGVKAQEWNHYEYKKGSCADFIQGRDCLTKYLCTCWIDKCCNSTKLQFVIFLILQQPWLRTSEDKLLQTVRLHPRNLNWNCWQFSYPCIQGWAIIQTTVTR